jgi:LmbE family N-acetylglucosaminyl deacetylase
MPVRVTLRSSIRTCLALVVPSLLSAQPGAVQLNDLTASLGTTARVLMIGAHPDDEDTQLLGWLARGAHTDAAYLSLTRGDGGQNAIGTQLGEGLGVIRTEELLAARRTDGARQFFTRAYDFGFSKTAVETYRHWPKDSVFGDVVRIIRAYRPHVIVAVFSGTPRDGHGHHQVSGLLAREAYDASMDTVRFPVAVYGAPWTVGKFYRAARSNATNATLRMDVGGYDPIRGQGLGEIAGQSRSQHRSQGFGVPQPRGVMPNYVRREASRVNEGTAADKETSMFDGLDASLQRFAPQTAAAQRPLLDSLVRTLAELRTGIDFRAPWSALPRIDLARRLLDRWCTAGVAARGVWCRGDEIVPTTVSAADADLLMSAARTFTQLQQLSGVASGLVLDATVSREFVAEGDTATIALRVTNRGPRPARVSVFTPSSSSTPAPRDSVAPGEAYVASVPLPSYPRTAPWWIRRQSDSALIASGDAGLGNTARNGDMFLEPASVTDEAARSALPEASVPALVDGIPVQLTAPIVYRRIDEVLGQLDRPVQFVPRVAVMIDGGAASYVRANTRIERVVTVRLTAYGPIDGPVEVTLRLPRGLTADTATRTVTLARGDETPVSFIVRGTLPTGRVAVSAVATAMVQGRRTAFASGFERIVFDHIRPQHLYRPAAIALEAVETAPAPRGIVGYVDGLADNVAPALEQLGATVEKLVPASLTASALRRYRVIVIGPRALEAQPALAGKMPMLHEWVRGGGTMIVQYQQADIGKPDMAPFPLTFARPANRVTEEDAVVRVLRPDSPLLTRPNRITERDWNHWVQERSTYVPATADSAYTPVLAMHDEGEPDSPNALLTAKLGRGTYVLSTLALFRQLPAGVPGAARLFVNLLNAGEPAPAPRRRVTP